MVPLPSPILSFVAVSALGAELPPSLAEALGRQATVPDAADVQALWASVQDPALGPSSCVALTVEVDGDLWAIALSRSTPGAPEDADLELRAKVVFDEPLSLVRTTRTGPAAARVRQQWQDGELVEREVSRASAGGRRITSSQQGWQAWGDTSLRTATWLGGEGEVLRLRTRYTEGPLHIVQDTRNLWEAGRPVGQTVVRRSGPNTSILRLVASWDTDTLARLEREEDGEMTAQGSLKLDARGRPLEVELIVGSGDSEYVEAARRWTRDEADRVSSMWRQAPFVGEEITTWERDGRGRIVAENVEAGSMRRYTLWGTGCVVAEPSVEAW